MVVKLNFVEYYSMVHMPKESIEKIRNITITQFKKWLESGTCTFVISDGIHLCYNELDVIRWLRQINCSSRDVYFLERYMDARKKSNYNPDIILEFENAEMEYVLRHYNI